ncbi:MAG: type III PLP-dependent enzyme, partial [Pikeienuella sp.]
GELRTGMHRPTRLFGPTCDSIDELPGPLAIPSNIKVGDWLLFTNMGAYSTAMATQFNGYGNYEMISVETFESRHPMAA